MLLGRDLEEFTSGFRRANEGVNISANNKYYSELTGIYWAWKNEEAYIVGSVHYRRHFTFTPTPIVYTLKKGLYYLMGLYRKRYSLIYTNDFTLWK